jgi:hypothetical protein
MSSVVLFVSTAGAEERLSVLVGLRVGLMGFKDGSLVGFAVALSVILAGSNCGIGSLTSVLRSASPRKFDVPQSFPVAVCESLPVESKEQREIWRELIDLGCFWYQNCGN